MKSKFITITLTQRCNLSCTYCYEKNKSNKSISVNSLLSILDDATKDICQYDLIEFDFFGGEPFLEFELIKLSAKHLEKYRNTGKVRLFVTTNGTLLNDEIKQWLIENEDWFFCGLSLDGTREMHNMNRSNSYDLIDWKFFLKQYPFQDIKMTISQKTLPHLATGIIDLHHKGFIVSCNLAYGIDWSDEDNSKILESELLKLVKFYIENPEIEPCSMLNIDLTNVGNGEKPTRYCGAGKYMQTYDVNGEYYPCQFFMPITVGEESAKISKKIQFPDNYLPMEKLDSKCVDCVINAACPNCFGANFIVTGDIYKRDVNMCRLTKIMFKAQAYYFARLWELNRLKGDEKNILYTLNAINIISNNLKID